VRLQASPSPDTCRSYVRRAPEHGVLHRIVRQHLQTFLWELDGHEDPYDLQYISSRLNS